MELGAGGRSIARGHESGSLNIPPPREQERKLEQEKLSGVVKSVHRRLRKKYREGKQQAGRGGGGEGGGGGGETSSLSPLFPVHSGQGPTITTQRSCTSATASAALPGPDPLWSSPQSASGALLLPHFLRRPFRRVPGLWRNWSPQPLQSPAAVLRLFSPHTNTYALTEEMEVAGCERRQVKSV